MRDPSLRHDYEAAMAAFVGDAGSSVPPIVPSATTRDQIEALKNNPEWRRQRGLPPPALPTPDATPDQVP